MWFSVVGDFNLRFYMWCSGLFIYYFAMIFAFDAHAVHCRMAKGTKNEVPSCTPTEKTSNSPRSVSICVDKTEICPGGGGGGGRRLSEVVSLAPVFAVGSGGGGGRPYQALAALGGWHEHAQIQQRRNFTI